MDLEKFCIKWTVYGVYPDGEYYIEEGWLFWEMLNEDVAEYEARDYVEKKFAEADFEIEDIVINVFNED